VDEHPRLLDGPYQFLAFAQSLLSFGVRLKFFRRKMRQKKTRKDFAIQVRRGNVLQDSFTQLASADNRSWLGRLHVTFANEPGVDGGGLLKEWFSCLTRELFNPGYALFLPTLSERSFQPNPGSGINPRHLAYFEFTGRIFAVAILNSVQLSAHLSSPFLKLLIGKSVSLEDLEDIDEAMFRGMKWILDNPVAKLPSELMFTTSSSEIGSSRLVELKENGASIIVTDENKREYIELLVDHRLKRAIESQAAAFCKGFHEFISQDELRVFGPHELDSVICGENIIDVDDWQRNCEFQGDYSPQHPVIALFFSVIRKWPQETLAKLLEFATGSPQVPLGGFAAFKEAGRPMIIDCGGEKARLATAHICENRLNLPKYEDGDEMNAKLLYAIENCGGFGMR
jgi:E3 ubiquitin-protein ligase HUWE1